MSTIKKVMVSLDKLADVDFTEPLEKVCLFIEGKAKEYVPVDTGELRNSITYEIDDNVGIVGTNKSYSP